MHKAEVIEAIPGIWQPLWSFIIQLFFRSRTSVLYNTAASSANRSWALQKQLDHNNLKTIFDFFIWSVFIFLFEGLYFALQCGKQRWGFYLLIRAQFFNFKHEILLNIPAFPFPATLSWQLRLGLYFFNMHGCLSCVYRALVIHFPTIKHQHEAISQCNRFVSSPSRSPGGLITGPSGPWRWFREKGGGKKQGVTGNC